MPDAGVLDRQPNGLVHQIGVATVKPRGDVRRADQAHEGAIVRVADPPATEGFPHVAIDVDDVETHLLTRELHVR